jgi:hypothetical protein
MDSVYTHLPFCALTPSFAFLDFVCVMLAHVCDTTCLCSVSRLLAACMGNLFLHVDPLRRNSVNGNAKKLMLWEHLVPSGQ